MGTRSGELTVTTPSDREIVMTREFDMLGSGMEEGAGESMEVLDEYLEILKAGTAR